MQRDKGQAAGHATCKAHAWDIERGAQGSAKATRLPNERAICLVQSKAMSFYSCPRHEKFILEGSCGGWPLEGGRANYSLMLDER